ncbi:nuclear exosome regulator NRDE2-like isoform X2 [Artemia franciscana]|uniref:Protein NRDE2 homolog n=1 Tax=Artemia franciscana TaxID=6661 RepID=A0AA88HIJ0_ARTSF|nr:hypothetical protein QYM36_016085 [Artemia franciscana]
MSLFPAYSSLQKGERDTESSRETKPFSDEEKKKAGSKRKRKSDKLMRKERKEIKKIRRKKYKRKKIDDSRDACEASSQGQIFGKYNKKLVFIDGTGLSPEEAFRLDTTPDRNNLTFGKPPKKITPKFKLASYNALGGDSDSYKGSPKGSCRYFQLFTKSEVKGRKTVSSDKSRNSIDSVINGESFLHILDIYDPATAAYVEGAEFSAKSSVNFPNDETLTREQVREFNKKLSKDPKNVDLWLAFVDFQDQAVMFETDLGKKKINPAVVCEKKLSILERAIKELPLKVELQLKRLEVGAVLWSHDNLRREWLEVLKLHPSNVELWNAYLNFMEHFGDFKVGDVLGGYQRCILKMKNLQQTLQGRKKSIENDLRGIFFRLCMFLKSTGYTEKAVGLYQIQLELAIRTPAELQKNPFNVLLQMADRFWDSHAPRLGEEGSISWCSIDRDNIMTRRFSQELEMESLFLKSNDRKEKKWPKLETYREERQWIPWTPTEEEDEADDKDRYVTLDELKPFLFSVSDQETATSLVIDYLRLLGCFDTQNDILNICSSDFLEIIFHTQIPKAFEIQSSYSKLLLSSSDSEVLRFIHNVVTQCLPYLDTCNQVKILNFWMDFEIVKLKYMIRQPELLQVYWKGLKRTVKKFLAMDQLRNNVLLYSRFIQLFDIAGEREQSTNIFLTLMTCQNRNIFDLPDDKKCDMLQILIDNAMMMLKNFRNGLVEKCEIMISMVQMLCEDDFVPNRKISKENVRRAKSRVQAIVENMAEDEPENLKCLWCQTLAILSFACDGFKEVYKVTKQVLEDQRKILIKCEGFNSIVLQIGSASVSRNEVGAYPALASLIVYLMEKFPCSPSVVTSFLEYQRLSRGSRRLCVAASSLIREKNECVYLVFALALSYQFIDDILKEGEKGLWCDVGISPQIEVDGFMFKTKHFLSSVLHDKLPCQRSVLLWLMYLKFLSRMGFKKELESAAYQALRESPFSKELILCTTDLIPEKFGFFYKIMNDKDIRVRIPPEELDLLLDFANQNHPEDI